MHFMFQLIAKQQIDITSFFCLFFLYLNMIECVMKGSARTQDPTPRNYTAELRTFVVIACVSSAGVQWHRLNMNPHPARST